MLMAQKSMISNFWWEYVFEKLPVREVSKNRILSPIKIRLHIRLLYSQVITIFHKLSYVCYWLSSRRCYYLLKSWLICAKYSSHRQSVFSYYYYLLVLIHFYVLIYFRYWLIYLQFFEIFAVTRCGFLLVLLVGISVKKKF